jgi:hypothetical protein
MVLNAADRMTAIEVVRLSESPDPFLVLEYLKQKNELLDDLPVIQCNKGTSHTVLLTAGDEPEGMARDYYQGTKYVSAQTKTLTEDTVTIEAWSYVDELLAKDSGNPDKLRNSTAARIITGMGVAQVKEFIYGKKTGAGPANAVNGLATRLDRIDNVNVFSMGGTGSLLTSIYLCAVGEHYFHLLYPQYGEGIIGIQRIDWKLQKGKDAKGNPYSVYEDQFRVRHGLAIPNPFAVKRIRDIAPDTDPEDLVDMILRVMRRVPDGAPTYALYANYTGQDILDKAARRMDNIIRAAEDPWGKQINMMRGYRIRTVEAIRDDEAAGAAAA